MINTYLDEKWELITPLSLRKLMCLLILFCQISIFSQDRNQETFQKSDSLKSHSSLSPIQIIGGASIISLPTKEDSKIITKKTENLKFKSKKSSLKTAPKRIKYQQNKSHAYVLISSETGHFYYKNTVNNSFFTTSGNSNNKDEILQFTGFILILFFFRVLKSKNNAFKGILSDFLSAQYFSRPPPFFG